KETTNEREGRVRKAPGSNAEVDEGSRRTISLRSREGTSVGFNRRRRTRSVADATSYRARCEERQAPTAAASLPGDGWEIHRDRPEGWRADRSGLVRESEGESRVRNPGRLQAHARPCPYRERRRTDPRLE